MPSPTAAAVDGSYPADGNGSFGESNVANGSDEQAGGVGVMTMDQVLGCGANEMHDQNGSGGDVQFKKGPWTALEDAILMEHVNTHGEGNWNSVYRCTGLARCGKSCRLRWSNHLKPNLRKGAFSPEEERIIVESHALFGNKWARMAVLLPGRTDNEIKNYWNTRVKRHQRLGIPLYPPHIQPVHHESPAKRGSHRRGGGHHQCAIPTTSPPHHQSFTFQTQLPSPTTPTYNPLFNNPTSPISPLQSPLPSPTTPSSYNPLFNNQTSSTSPLPSPTTPSYYNPLFNNQTSSTSPLPSPTTPSSYNPLFNNQTSSISPLPSPTTPISKPLFQTCSPHHSPLPSPRSTPLQLASHHLHSPRSPTPPIPCSFTFQTQPFINSPTNNHHHLHHHMSTSSNPTTPTHTPTTTSLPHLNISIPPRSPPKLVQSPLLFRRFPSFALSPITTTTTNVPSEASSVSPHEMSGTNASPSSSCAFQREMEEENNRLCSLLADITHHHQQCHQLEHQQQRHHLEYHQQQQQLPSIQFLQPGNHINHNAGFHQPIPHFDHQNVELLQQHEAPPTQFLAINSAANAASSTASAPSPILDRRGGSKRKNREEEDEDGYLFMDDGDLLVQERGGDDQHWSGKTGHFVIDQDDHDKGLFDGLPGTWNHVDSFSQCPGMGPNGESTSEINIIIPEGLTSLVNSMTTPTDMNTHSFAGGGTSGDQSSVVAGEKTDVLKMHQIASLFSSSADHDRAAQDNCSWENLSEICR